MNVAVLEKEQMGHIHVREVGVDEMEEVEVGWELELLAVGLGFECKKSVILGEERRKPGYV